jgi:poly(A) polymerase|tara:strand:+ start:390 stop:1667 length:1278 start_codon:yes stop_codon:yes gene_type:complete
MIIKNPKTTFLNKVKFFFSPFYKSREIKFIFNILEKNEPKNKKIAMFVGGCVRKHLLNEEIDDIDIATVLNTDTIKEKFKNLNVKIIDSGIKHGTITLLLNKKKFEITTLRKDVKTDGRHAEVTFIDDWVADSQRRDFSINAIYLDRNGKVFDPQAGVIDLKNNIVKFIGVSDQRIQEDYLRIIRFIRFSLQYPNDLIENNTVKSIKLNLDGIKKLSKERIFSELIKIFKLKNFSQITRMKDLNIIFSLIFPEFRYAHRLNKLDILFKNKIDKINTSLMLSLLLIDDSNNHEYFSHKYKISNEIKEKLSLMARSYKDYKTDKNYLKSNLTKNIYLIGKDNIQRLIIFLFLESEKMTEQNFLSYSQNIKDVVIPKFPFNGTYLLSVGITEGKKIGLALKELEKKWLENEFSLSNENLRKILKSLKN